MLRNLQFLCSAAFGLQLLSNSAALRVEFPSHLIEAHKRKRVPVVVFEAGEHSTPIRLLRWMMKTNPSLTPVLELGVDILSNKNNLPGSTDELVFLRVGLGSDKRQDRGAIRRGNRDPATSAFKTVISDQAESKLV